MKLKQYKKLEKSLEQRADNKKENEVYLGEEDFKDGKISMYGYQCLKQQCEYIPYKEDIEIKVPGEYQNNFKETLLDLGASELAHIKKDQKENKISAMLLLFAGIFLIGLGAILDAGAASTIWKEVTIIASWVFIWGAVEKWFFDGKKLTDKKRSLFHILSAKIL